MLFLLATIIHGQVIKLDSSDYGRFVTDKKSYEASYTIETSSGTDYIKQVFTVKMSYEHDMRLLHVLEHTRDQQAVRELSMCKNGIRKDRIASVIYQNENRQTLSFKKVDDTIYMMLAHDVPMLWHLLRPPVFSSEIYAKDQLMALKMMIESKDYVAKRVHSDSLLTYQFASLNDAKFDRRYIFDLTNEKKILRHSMISNDGSEETATATYSGHDYPSSVLVKFTSPGKSDKEYKITFQHFLYRDKIEKNEFSLDSMKIRDGTLIGYPELDDVQKYPIWEGTLSGKTYKEEFEKKILNVNPIPSIPKPSLISQAWPYFLGFVIFAVIGFWLLRKQWQAAKEG